LTAVRAQPRSAQGQQDGRSACRIIGLGERDGDGGPFQRQHGFAGRQSRKRRTTLCDIRRVVWSNGLVIPLDYNTSAIDEMSTRPEFFAEDWKDLT